MEEGLNEKVQLLDKILLILHRRKFRRFYSIEDLQRKVPALRLWNALSLKNDLDIMNGAAIDKKPDYNPTLEIVQKISRKGKDMYRYNPFNYTRNKLYKQISYSFKTDEEIKEITKKDFEYTKLKRDVFFWIDFKWWFGVIVGAVAMFCALAGVYLNYLKCK